MRRGFGGLAATMVRFSNGLVHFAFRMLASSCREPPGTRFGSGV